MKHLLVTIDATHGGFVNHNFTWYLDDAMRAAVESWTKPFNKPFLKHHNMDGDAIGYVVGAEYFDMSPIGGKKKNTPSGGIRLKAIICDQDAITKVKDKRYGPVSVSMTARYARCSICDQIISEKGLCAHKRGKTYKGKLCFYYVGDIRYKEVSYVNAPADEYVETISIVEKEGINPMPKQNDGEKTVNVRFTFADSDTPDIKVISDEEIADWTDYTEDDLQMAHWLMVEMDTELGDAKLSTEKRKSLPASSFCGPNKSFPVNDCAHVTAARRLIGRYKGPGDKSKILACVDRKAKSLKCGGSKDSIIEPVIKDQGDKSMEFSEIIVRKDVRDFIEAEVVKRTQDQTAQLSGLKALDEKVKTQDAALVTKDAEIKILTETKASLEKDNETLKTEIHKTLVDKVFDARKKLQKKDVMELKDEAAVDAYKATLTQRTDQSLQDAIQDLKAEDAVVPEVKPVIQKADGEIADSEKTKTGKVIKSVDPVERSEQVKNFFFAKSTSEESK